ncbi:MAG TPA: hypothetical protein VFO21_03270 [Vicinamibacterales bacterium]|nr:hypothetical protein [Vicinamibacterales bacterium]
MVSSAAFVAMIRAFLLTILLAALFAGLSYPVYEWIRGSRPELPFASLTRCRAVRTIA